MIKVGEKGSNSNKQGRLRRSSLVLAPSASASSLEMSQDALLDSLAQDIQKINQIAACIQTELQDQTMLIDSIDSSTDYVCSHVNAGVTELRQAARYSSGTRFLLTSMRPEY